MTRKVLTEAAMAAGVLSFMAGSILIEVDSWIPVVMCLGGILAAVAGYREHPDA